MPDDDLLEALFDSAVVVADCAGFCDMTSLDGRDLGVRF
jgi:hypothetical protein